VRGAARGLIAAAAAWIVACSTSATAAPDLSRSIRGLDGGQFLEDEPIWVCDSSAPAPAPASSGLMIGGRIVGVEENGRAVESRALARSFREPPPRSGELVRAVWFDPRRDLHPLDVGSWGGGSLRAGVYQFVRGDRTLARFRVVTPRASEAAVRAALARAARLSREKDGAKLAEAARLYEAVLARYPRTSYVTSIYAGLWRLRGHTSAYATDPGAWLEAVFAHFHDSCFGVWALDRYMSDIPLEEAGPLLRRLVGLYPDTPLSRAAARYLP
jgi:hypothetical protein